MRLFAAISLPNNVRDHLSQALAMVTPPGARHPWGPADNWHITLAFYGEQPESLVDQLAEHLRLAASQTAAFELRLAHAGVFRHDVCWVGVNDPTASLGPLAQRVRADFAHGDQHTQNRFHVTISRSGRRAGLGDALTALAVYQGPTWLAERLTLFRSDLGQGPSGHPLHTPLATVDLSA